MQLQFQADFQNMNKNLDELQSFMLELLKQNNPQAYSFFCAEINQKEQVEDKKNGISSSEKV